ncbi:MAG: PKD domain-containing protein [candidate division Zixibacteria bacterium]|nr:PKD domain-containing protein [candidate division Zixibacteria bacterium]
MNKSKILTGILLTAALMLLSGLACDELTTEITEVTEVSLQADFKASVEVCCAPCEITFDDISSGGIVIRSWNFGDDTVLFETVEGYENDTLTKIHDTITHVYTGSGIYDVSLIVTDTGGQSDSEVKKRFIIVDRASSEIAADTTQGCLPLTVQFRSVNFKGNTDWHWDFGDPSTDTDTSAAPHPRYTYTNPGVFTVTLITRNTLCDSVLADTMIWEDSITVSDCPRPSLVMTGDSSGCVPLTVNLSTMVEGVFDTLIWSFGDGTLDTVFINSDTTGDHEYTTAGTYTIGLTAIGPEGSAIITLDSAVHAYDSVAASYVVDDTVGCLDTTITDTMEVNFECTSTGSVDSVWWDFGDGTDTVITESPKFEVLHAYTTAGYYTISLQTFGKCNTSTGIDANAIAVLDHAPVASLSLSDPADTLLQVVPGASISLISESTDAFSWEWFTKLGTAAEVSISTNPNPTWVIPQDTGLYTIRLVVTNPCGDDTFVATNLVHLIDTISTK